LFENDDFDTADAGPDVDADADADAGVVEDAALLSFDCLCTCFVLTEILGVPGCAASLENVTLTDSTSPRNRQS
jgi:hypothetical protein